MSSILSNLHKPIVKQFPPKGESKKFMNERRKDMICELLIEIRTSGDYKRDAELYDLVRRVMKL